MAGALAGRHTEKELEKGRVENTRVTRYWPGKAPDWVKEDNAEETLVRGVQRTAIAAPVIVKKADDPRLARLAQRRVDREAAVQEHRQIRAAEIVRRRGEADEGAPYKTAGSDEEESESDEEEEDQQEEQAEEDEEELQRRRDALRERLRQQQQQRKQEQELLAAQGEEASEEESSEYETDSEEEDGPAGPRLIKPVFVPKAQRETIVEREKLELEEEAAEEARKARLVERKAETKEIFHAVIAAEAAAAAAVVPEGRNTEEDIVTDDEDETVAFDAWCAREMERLRRDRDEREAQDKEAAEREKIKSMTDEERAAYFRANPRASTQASNKPKWGYLQKYWHKGAFFQESPDDVRGTVGQADIFKRDFSAPTGEDKFDKSLLPAVMQVKNFGRSGRSKWTHLLAEDTSTAAREDEWYRKAEDPSAGATAGGYKRDTAALQADLGSWQKRKGGEETDGFSKPKKFKT